MDIKPVTKEAKRHMDKVDGKKNNMWIKVLILLFIANLVAIYIFNL